MNSEFNNRKYNNSPTDSWLKGLSYGIPKKCPHCHFSNQPTLNANYVYKYDEGYLQVFSWICTHCSKYYTTGHTRKDSDDKDSQFLFIFPSLQPREFDKLISDLSPRFIEIYQEANWSEQQGNFTVAGMGYRLALEILVKDYAIIELGLSEDDVAKKSLFNAIEEYLPSAEQVAAADVVRLKGNDYAHYKEKFDNVEFEDMKFYLDTLIDSIYVQLRLKHPPVRR